MLRYHPAYRVFIYILLFFCVEIQESYGQGKNEFLYRDVPESILYETKWQYKYTLHVESQTIIHRAGDHFQAYYYFRLDKKAESVVNGTHSTGTWLLDRGKLNAPILNTDSLRVVKATDVELILEGSNKTGKGNLQYYFEHFGDDGQIFKKPEYLLPELTVNTKRENVGKNSVAEWFKNFWQQLWGLEMDDSENLAGKPYINIEIIGGGYFGGIDPTEKNYIQLKNNGRLIREYATQYQGQTKTIKDISRQELESLAEYLDTKGFFALQASYDYTDPECFKRKLKRPLPIPLRISVTYGLRHKVISVAMFGNDGVQDRYLSYPLLVDELVEILNRMANRIE